MILNSSQLTGKALSGEKTQHRVPVAHPDQTRPQQHPERRVTRKGKPRTIRASHGLRPGAAVAVQAEFGRKAAGRVTVTHWTRSTWEQTTDLDAQAEGHRDLLDLLDHWGDRDLEAECWVLHLRPIEQGTDRPRLLAVGGTAPTYPRGMPDLMTEGGHPDPSGDPDAERGYTSRPDRALPGESEAVDPDLIDDWTRRSRLDREATRDRRKRGIDLARGLRTR